MARGRPLEVELELLEAFRQSLGGARPGPPSLDRIWGWKKL